MRINAGGILQKLGAYTSSSAFKKKKSGVSEQKALLIATMAGEDLASSITNAIHSLFNEGAANAVGGVYSNQAIKIGDGRYSIEINIDQNYRSSLVPEVYGGVKDMAVLLYKGYTAGNRVHGMWHGKEIWSLAERSGTDYIWKGINDFMGSGAGNARYKVIDVSVGDRFS